MSTRSTKIYSITMPPELGRQAEQLAKRESRTMSELMREAFRHYQRQAEDRRILSDAGRRRSLAALKEAVAELRAEAAGTSAGKPAARRIDAEIAASARTPRKRKKIGSS
jgi:predicted DNA-binding protein